MKVTVLVGSPHKNGSSSIMADSFEKGLKENGHEINRFNLCDLNVAPWTEESADVHDDFDKILESLQESDLFVISTPIFYFGFPAQLKAVIDRFQNVNHYVKHAGENGNGLKTVLLTVSYRDDEPVMDAIKKHYEMLCEYLNWHSQGIVLGTGCGTPGMTSTSKHVDEAYELAKSIK